MQPDDAEMRSMGSGEHRGVDLFRDDLPPQSPGCKRLKMDEIGRYGR